MSVIKALNSLDDAVLILRNAMIEKLNVDGQQVLNALSVYGADLAKIVQDVQDSIKHEGSDPENTQSDVLILFEVSNDEDSKNNMIQGEVVYEACKMHLTIYGDDSEEVSVKLKTALLEADEKVALNLQGVQIASISNISAVNEFKNETLWQRRDMDIYFAFRR